MGELIGQVEATSLTIRVLGPLEVTAAGRVIALGGPKPRLLLAALALQPNVVVSTEVLVEVLWPASAPRSAAANIRTYVHSLRRRFAEIDPGLGERISNRASGYLLTASPGELDHLAFTAAAGDAREALDRGDAESALTVLDRAEGLWRGEVLEGLPHDHSWGATVARLAELRLSVQEQRLRARIDLGRGGEAVAELRGLVTEHPLREELWAQLIVALRAAGRTTDAIDAFDAARRVLREELGAEPGARLRELRATLVVSESVPATRPADLAPICQLPLDLPDFTGRDDVIREVVALMKERAERNAPAVIVLSGAPGVGKSAVAVRVAHAVRDDFPDGQLHVDLAGDVVVTARADGRARGTAARAGHPGQPACRAKPAERAALLRSRLAGRRMCVVLDDAGSAAQVRPLLPGSRRVRGAGDQPAAAARARRGEAGGRRPAARGRRRAVAGGHRRRRARGRGTGERRGDPAPVRAPAAGDPGRRREAHPPAGLDAAAAGRPAARRTCGASTSCASATSPSARA